MSAINWSTLDTAVRKAHDFVLESHRYVREGCLDESSPLRGPSQVRIAAIGLRNYLDKIIATEDK